MRLEAKRSFLDACTYGQNYLGSRDSIGRKQDTFNHYLENSLSHTDLRNSSRAV